MLRIIHHRFAASRKWLQDHQKIGYSIVTVGIMIFAGLSLYLVEALSAKPQMAADIPIKPRPKPVYYAPLTGIKVKSAADLKKPVNAIIIENSPDARPQSGLKEAEVVYEAVAEGGVTRFLAMYQQNKPKLIGPVRSLRPYYIDWLKPYDASIYHVGGSAKALKEVRSGGYKDLDQFFNDQAYYRSTDRLAPHNVYTTSKRIQSLNKSKKYTSSKPKVFERIDESPAKIPTARTISVSISDALFNSSYKYDTKKNRYIRSQAGAQHKDREKGVITSKVIIVMNVDERTERQETEREVITTSGSGKVTIFQDGIALKGTWTKKNQASQLMFKDADGESIKLVRGQTWITAIPNGKGTVSWKK